MTATAASTSTPALSSAGAPLHGEPTAAPTPRPEIDADLALLQAKKEAWVAVPARDRRAIVAELRRDFLAVSKRWVTASVAGEGIDPTSPTVGEEWIAGPYILLRGLRLLEDALAGIEEGGRPRLPGPVRELPDGRAAVRVMPYDGWDRLLYAGVEAEVWMQPGVGIAELPKTQAVAYSRPDRQGKVCLVLGAGNVSSIGPLDVLYKLFVEDEVVLYKTHPLNAYLGPLLAEGFQALRDWGVLRIVDGGADVGSYLCEHPAVETIHITGSDKTVEAIAFGVGAEGARRKREGKPKLQKAISSELGNVSPVIVVPGDWSGGDLAHQAENVAAMLTNNAGFNCNAARVLVTHAGWPQRDAFLVAVEQALAAVKPRRAYYPGAEDRFATFVGAHPEATRIGDVCPGELPWTLIRGIDPEAQGDVAFRVEAFASICAETPLAAASTADFVAAAAAFANDRLWGTLNATILVHPREQQDPVVGPALERAIEALRYGTVAVNVWAAAGYALGVTPWGAYPGHTLTDIQSGTGVVHNTLMFDRVEKTVIRGPFRVRPKPIWFPSHRTVHKLGPKLAAFEAAPSPLALPGIFFEALQG